jgi:beta-1,4-N-acetylglucosaminyltransferase
MIKLLGGSDMNVIQPREYIIADTDQMSLQKIKQFENKRTDFLLNKISRSRHVGQSYITSVFTTLWAILYSIPLICRIKPHLLLINGPGTCLPCCLIVFVFSRILFLIPKCKIVFVESSKLLFIFYFNA